MNNSKVSAIILAGGSGSRMNSSVTKQRMMLGNISVLRRCVLAFEKCSEVDEIIVVAKESEINEIRVELADIAKLSKVVPGGASRAESAMNGVSAMNYQSDYVAIHDAARPAIISEMIEKVIFIAKEKGCGYLTLNVWKLNEGAQKFYEKMGMKPLKIIMETIL